MNDPLLTVDAISLGFHNEGRFAHILGGANLAMNRGEIMGLVGESGCG
jgi:ABC-type glutathione transport system ATPase component